MRTLVTLPLVALLVGPMPAARQEKKDDKKDSPPKVLFALPLVVRPGETQKLALRGLRLDAVKEVAVAGADEATVKVVAAKKVAVPNNYSADRVGDSEVEVELTLPKGASAVTLTAGGPGGGSNAYTLLVRDDTPAVTEVEPNDALVADGANRPQAVTLPCAVEGTIKGEKDVDVFAFAGRKGDVVVLDVQAARFGSPLDAYLSVYDADHRLVAQADDGKDTPDPTLTLTLPRDGPFHVVVADAHDQGGPAFGYRLVVKKRD